MYTCMMSGVEVATPTAMQEHKTGILEFTSSVECKCEEKATFCYKNEITLMFGKPSLQAQIGGVDDTEVVLETSYAIRFNLELTTQCRNCNTPHETQARCCATYKLGDKTTMCVVMIGDNHQIIPVELQDLEVDQSVR